MRRIMILNSKGGCGKSTISTNLAGYFASQGTETRLLDFDPQQSSIDWLKMRPEDRPRIGGLSANIDNIMIPNHKGVLIIDTPAGMRGKELKSYVRHAHTIIIPVLPSPIDMRATARFIESVLLLGKVDKKKVRLAVVANRVRKQTRIYQGLRRFLKSLDIPFIAVLRESQNYIRAADEGLSIFEGQPSKVEEDLHQWQPIIKWLKSSASHPLQSKKKGGKTN
ncbi:MAG: ParA family protein [Gammaproteobacteria bacterium]|nr:ParA family protein [Gammaproteobacteria bacterium]